MAAAEFNWEDPLDLEAQLTDEERMIRDSARAFAQDKLAPRVRDAVRHEKMDVSIFRDMGEVGLLGPTIDKPIAIGYVDAAFATLGTRMAAIVRGKPVPMEVVSMPFVPTNYFRG